MHRRALTLLAVHVRVPNEDLVKSRITNLTHFPVRRNDILLSVAYKEDLTKIREILFEIADRNTLCLDEPIPVFIFKKFGECHAARHFSPTLRKLYATP